MRILLCPCDHKGCGRYRLGLPASALQAQETTLEIFLSEGLPVRLDLETGRALGLADGFTDWDVVVVQRPMAEWQVEALRDCRRLGVRTVVEVDDDFEALHHLAPAFYSTHPRVSTEWNRKWLRVACREANLVTVTTPALAERYASHGRVAIIPNYFPEAWLSILRNPSPDRRVVGWTGTVGTHQGDLSVPRGGVAQAIRETGATFRVVGNPELVRRDLALDKEPENVPWLEWGDYAFEIARLDVGIAPLADTAFNRAKCFDRSMLIMTDSGIRQIGDLSPADRVWYDSKWRWVEAVEHAPETDGLEITTSLGLRLQLTPNHRLLSGGMWKRADQLGVGDSLSLEGEEWPQSLPYVQAPWPAESRMSRRRDADHLGFVHAESGPRITLDERWGRFLGLYAGDGSAGGPGGVTFSMDGQDADLIDLLFDDLHAIGLYASTQRERTTWDGKVLRRRSVSVSSTALTRVLEHLGVLERKQSGATKRVVRVPDCIWTSPRTVVAAFLSGLFEADGTTGREGGSISFCTMSEGFAREVQRLLVGFGIFSRLQSRQGPPLQRDPRGHRYWYVSLRRASTDVFAREIGFLSERKRARLALGTAKPHSNAYKPMPTSDEIVSITPCTVRPVDLQVEGSVFVAAGIVSHNSWLKPLEYAALGVPSVVSPLPSYVTLAKQGIGILAKDRSRDWRREVKKLVEDVYYREECSASVRESAARFTIEGNAHKFAEAWTSTTYATSGSRS